jgi:hypothetical protein
VGTTNFIATAGTSSKTNVVSIINVDIEQTNVYVCASCTNNCTNIVFSLTNSVANAVWSLSPTNVVNGLPASIVASNATSITVAPGTANTNYTVKAWSPDLPTCTDTATLSALRVQIVESNVWAVVNTNVVLHLTNSTAQVDWLLVPSNVVNGASLVGGGGTATLATGTLITNYTIIARSQHLTNCLAVVPVNVFSGAVTNLKFNWDPAAATGDALNIRADYNTPYNLTHGEWVAGTSTNYPAAYTTNRTVTLRARLAVSTNVTSGTIWAESTDSGGSLGNILKATVSFLNGTSGWVAVTLAGATTNCVAKTVETWRWKIENINGSGSAAMSLNESGPHTIYTLLGEPQAPWDNTADSQRNAWVVVLDRPCTWATGSTNAAHLVSKVTTNSYSMPDVTYDGGQHFTFPDKNQFHLKALLAALAGGGAVQMDCRDFANWVHALTASVGVASQYRVVQRMPGNDGFDYNYLLPSGHAAWSTGWWNFHQFGWWNGRVCDASTKLDGDADPTKAPHVERLAVGDMTQADYLDALTETAGVTDVETGTCVLTD